MRFSFTVAGAVALLASTVVGKHIAVHGRSVGAGPAYPELQARFDPSLTSKTHYARGGPSRTRHAVAADAVDAADPSKRDGGAFSFNAVVRTRAHGFLSDFFTNINVHYSNVQSHCSGMLGGGIEVSIGIKWLLIELNAILALFITLIADLRGCGQGGPSPSGSPGNPPSIVDICVVIFWIIRCLLHVCLEIVACAVQFVEVKDACSSVLFAISAQIIELIDVCEWLFGGCIKILFGLCFGLFIELGSVGFGFEVIVQHLS